VETLEREPWVNYLEGDVLGKQTIDQIRVYQVVIKVRGEGLLGVVKGRRGAEYFVAFVGAGTLSALAAKIRGLLLSEEEKFKVDQWPPT